MTQLRRFFAPPGQWSGETVVLDPEETHHLSRVLRLKIGARVAVVNGQGRAGLARVQALSPQGAILYLEEELPHPAESPLKVVLGVGLAKGETMDLVVRQATEMGVHCLFPFISAYSEKPEPERAARRLARWRRHAREALKSCQRLFLPEILPVQDFTAALSGPEETKLMFYEAERGGGLAALLGGVRPRSVRLLLGPEGGFTSEEVVRAREAGFQLASLGPRRLRVETAALAAMALVQYAWGDLA
jgi:16S rRNA (uracil1498-N3)-methyltransferase